MVTPEELEGVTAHELAHIKHRHMLVSTVAATMAGAIGILASILFAAGPAIMRTAKKNSTRSDMKALEIAINDFYTEYGRYPVPSATKTDLFIGGEDGTSTAELRPSR